MADNDNNDTIPAPFTPEAVATPRPAPKTVDEVAQVLGAYGDKVAALLTLAKEIDRDYRVLAKDVTRSLKTSTRPTRRSRPASSSPSGFAVPARLSDELCEFLALPINSVRPRTEVTQLLSAYIREHNLRDDNDKRRILPDDKLGRLLAGDKDIDKPTTYFNLQNRIKHHFSKVEAASA